MIAPSTMGAYRVARQVVVEDATFSAWLHQAGMPLEGEDGESSGETLFGLGLGTETIEWEVAETKKLASEFWCVAQMDDNIQPTVFHAPGGPYLTGWFYSHRRLFTADPDDMDAGPDLRLWHIESGGSNAYGVALTLDEFWAAWAAVVPLQDIDTSVCTALRVYLALENGATDKPDTPPYSLLTLERFNPRHFGSSKTGHKAVR